MNMKFHIVTIFPDSVNSYLSSSILKRAQKKRLISIKTIDPRVFAKDKHRTTDDRPYGGGPGMVMKAEPILGAIATVVKKNKKPASTDVESGGQETRNKIIILSASGKQFAQTMARKWAKLDSITLIAGRYEGIDARVKRALKAEEISIGPYVLSGGELGAMVVLEAIARHIPGVLGKLESLEEHRGGVGIPMYTRPETFIYKGKKYRTPKVLISGDHNKIDQWRSKHRKRA